MIPIYHGEHCSTIFKYDIEMREETGPRMTILVGAEYSKNVHVFTETLMMDRNGKHILVEREKENGGFIIIMVPIVSVA